MDKIQYILSLILLKIPFSYLWVIKKSMGEPTTVLDLGCGNGILMTVLSRKGKEWITTGVDLYKKDAKNANRLNTYENIIIGDVIETSQHLIKKGKKYDLVFSSQLIEHLNKKQGHKLLKLMNKLARNRIVVATPNGYIKQRDEYVGENKHQHHLSGWSAEEFKKKGYEVRGVGFRLTWSEGGLGRDENKVVSSIFTFISFIIAPIVYFFPSLGAGIIAIKLIK